MNNDTKKPENSDFSIVLHPHRSLGPRGFLILMVCFGSVSFATGLAFLLMGAWPVLGFFGLDVLLVYCAFKFNYKAGRQCEILNIKKDELLVRQILQNGRETIRAFQAYWARLVIKNGKLLVLCRAEQMEIGGFLVEEEKEQVRDALSAALYEYRHGNRNG